MNVIRRVGKLKSMWLWFYVWENQKLTDGKLLSKSSLKAIKCINKSKYFPINIYIYIYVFDGRMHGCDTVCLRLGLINLAATYSWVSNIIIVIFVNQKSRWASVLYVSVMCGWLLGICTLAITSAPASKSITCVNSFVRLCVWTATLFSKRSNNKWIITII